MAAGNETSNFVRDGSMLPHHIIDTSTTPNSWKQIYPYEAKFGDVMRVKYLNADGLVEISGIRFSILPNDETLITLPVALVNTNYAITTGYRDITVDSIPRVGWNTPTTTSFNLSASASGIDSTSVAWVLTGGILA